MKRIELTGERFGRWLVLSYAGMCKAGGTWLCRCDCGVERIVSSQGLRRSSTTSCGCAKAQAIGVKKTIHGHSPKRGKSRVYRIWRHMIRRCHSPNEHNFRFYGGRGISVCERWRTSFVNFLTDMGEPPTPKHSIDRTNNNGNYEPGNCQWETQGRQNRNRRHRS